MPGVLFKFTFQMGKWMILDEKSARTSEMYKSSTFAKYPEVSFLFTSQIGKRACPSKEQPIGPETK